MDTTDTMTLDEARKITDGNREIIRQISDIEEEAEKKVELLLEKMIPISDVMERQISVCDHLRNYKPDKFNNLSDEEILRKMKTLNDIVDGVVNPKWVFDVFAVEITNLSELDFVNSQLTFKTDNMLREVKFALGDNLTLASSVWALIEKDGTFVRDSVAHERLWPNKYPVIEICKNMFNSPKYITDIYAK